MACLRKASQQLHFTRRYRVRGAAAYWHDFFANQ